MSLPTSILIESQFFPPITTFLAVAQTEQLVIEACEHYQKGSYRNRCHIAHSMGTQVLSVPLRKGKNAKLPIRDVEISYDIDWQKQHWQSLQTAYGSAPFWEYYSPLFESIYNQKYVYLLDLNTDILKLVLKILKLNNTIKVTFSEEYQKDYHSLSIHDRRNQISPKHTPQYFVKYSQLFQDRMDFIPHLSILDLIFCTGNRALDVLKSPHKLVSQEF